MRVLVFLILLFSIESFALTKTYSNRRTYDEHVEQKYELFSDNLEECQQHILRVKSEKEKEGNVVLGECKDLSGKDLNILEYRDEDQKWWSVYGYVVIFH